MACMANIEIPDPISFEIDSLRHLVEKINDLVARYERMAEGLPAKSSYYKNQAQTAREQASKWESVIKSLCGD